MKIDTQVVFRFSTDDERKQYIQDKFDQIIIGILERDMLLTDIDSSNLDIV